MFTSIDLLDLDFFVSFFHSYFSFIVFRASLNITFHQKAHYNTALGGLVFVGSKFGHIYDLYRIELALNENLLSIDDIQICHLYILFIYHILMCVVHTTRLRLVVYELHIYC